MLNILDDIHGKGIIHRDLNPSNLVLGIEANSHRIMLIDFDSAINYRDAITE